MKTARIEAYFQQPTSEVCQGGLTLPCAIAQQHFARS